MTNSYKKWNELKQAIHSEPITAYDMSEINGLGYKQNIRMFRDLIEIEPEKYELTKVGRAIAIKIKELTMIDYDAFRWSEWTIRFEDNSLITIVGDGDKIKWIENSIGIPIVDIL